MRQEIRHLPVRLTDEEWREKAGELATVVQDVAVEEGRQNDLRAQMKSRMTQLTARQSLLASVVHRKEEIREVVVEYRPDYERKTLDEVRTDTWEILNSRRLRDDELQGHLELEEA